MGLLYLNHFISDVFYKEGIFGFSLGSKWWTFLYIYIYTQDIPAGIQIATVYLFLLILQSDPTLRFLKIRFLATNFGS